MKVLILDNYDSFTYNLSHIVEGLGVEVDVIRDNEVAISEVAAYDKLIISPGPGLPKETKNMFSILEKYHTQKPILGVCLGMQGIVEFFGGTLEKQQIVQHGVTTQLKVVDVSATLFQGLPKAFQVGLYHSWKVKELPECLNLAAQSKSGVVMAVAHTSLPIVGVQFHPESILTENGKTVLKNFLMGQSNTP